MNDGDSDLGADWGQDEDNWVGGGYLQDWTGGRPALQEVAGLLPLFPVDYHPRGQQWLEQRPPAMQRAFWEPYRRCDLSSFLPWQEDSPAQGEAWEEPDPLDCEYEHLGDSSAAGPSTLAPLLGPLEVIGSELVTLAHLRTLVTFLHNKVLHESSFMEADVVVVLTDSNPLTEYPHWRHTSRVFRERIRMSNSERWTVVVVPLTDETGLGSVHYTWGSPFVLEALMAAAPGKHYPLRPRRRPYCTL